MTNITPSRSPITRYKRRRTKARLNPVAKRHEHPKRNDLRNLMLRYRSFDFSAWLVKHRIDDRKYTRMLTLYAAIFSGVKGAPYPSKFMELEAVARRVCLRELDQATYDYVKDNLLKGEG